MRTVFEKAASKATSHYVMWDKEKPLRGHCAVVALYLYDLLGGWIMTGLVKRDDGRMVRHYWWADGCNILDPTMWQNDIEDVPERGVYSQVDPDKLRKQISTRYNKYKANVAKEME